MYKQNDSQELFLLEETSLTKANFLETIDEIIFHSLPHKYQVNIFKKDKINIEIFSPLKFYPGLTRKNLKNSDYIKFILSLYPYHSDLIKIENILLLPRYFEFNDIELMALYLAQNKTLIIYLFQDENYPLKFIPDKELLLKAKQFAMIKDNTLSWQQTQPLMPSLWHIISILAKTENEEKDIEKFFIKKKYTNLETLKNLQDINDFYAKDGY